MLDACIRSHLFQGRLETERQFTTAKQFAHIGASGLVVELDSAASRLMQGNNGRALASFGIGLCFENGSELNSLFFPSANVQFFDEVSQVLTVHGIEEEFVFSPLPLCVRTYDL